MQNSATYIPDFFDLPANDSLKAYSFAPSEVSVPLSATGRIGFSPVEKPLPLYPHFFNSGFILFFFAFMIVSYVFRTNWRMFGTMLTELFKNKDRNSIFSETTGTEKYSRVLLCIQASVVLSILSFCFYYGGVYHYGKGFVDFWVSIGGGILIFLFFFVLKSLLYAIVGGTFFRFSTVSLWRKDYVSILCFSGLILFIPALILFFVKLPAVYNLVLYFSASYLIAVLAFILYKTFVLFFKDIRLLFYLFLYLCVQEIFPLLLLIKGIMGFYNFAESNSLWL